jgi:hypothetical protein
MLDRIRKKGGELIEVKKLSSDGLKELEQIIDSKTLSK